jgi:pimeloyl-ACP methyl ester carboxylesterase
MARFEFRGDDASDDRPNAQHEGRPIRTPTPAELDGASRVRKESVAPSRAAAHTPDQTNRKQMIDTTASTATSRDGTKIAFWSTGSGPPLLFVHGTTADHTSWELTRPHLESEFTMHVLDRRGRGGSGDHVEYSIDREYDDIVAVVDVVARHSGSAVHVFGHSFGGTVALGAAARSSDVGRLVVYEPPVRPDFATLNSSVAARLDEIAGRGDFGGALEFFYRQVVGVGQDEVEMFKSLPSWEPRAAAVHTVIREFREDFVITEDMLRHIDVPTLFLLGSESPDWVQQDIRHAAQALPGSTVALLDGQEHIAHYTAPETLARVVWEFLTG